MERIEVNGVTFVVTKKFQQERVKDMELLAQLKGFYGADTVIKGGTPAMVYLCQKIDDAVIVDEVVTEREMVDGFLLDENVYEVE